MKRLNPWKENYLLKESNSSIKVEANDAKVVHGGESVAAEPVLKKIPVVLN